MSVSSSLRIKNPDGRWVSADLFGLPPQMQLLEAENTVLGRVYIPLKNRLHPETLAENEVHLLLTEGDQIASQGNQVLTHGICYLFEKHASKVIGEIKKTPGKWPALSPYLLKNEPYHVRAHCLEKILTGCNDPVLIIDAARILGTHRGAQTLGALLPTPLGKTASEALAQFPVDEIPVEIIEEARKFCSLFPVLNAITHPPLANNSEIFQSIDRSFLSEGVVFAHRRSSLDFSDEQVFQATAEVMRRNIVEAIKLKRQQPRGESPENTMRPGAITLLDEVSLKEKLKDLANQEIPLLFATLGIPMNDSQLAAMCLHDRCFTETHLEQGEFEQSLYRFIGRWRWVASQCALGKTTSLIETELKSLIQHGESVPVGDVIAPQGVLDLDPNHEYYSLDVIQSFTGSEVADAAWFDRENDAFQGGLPSIGVEIQNLEIPIEDFYPWKDFLRSHGIRSAWRPEFGSQVEAAIPPFFSTSNLREVISRLEQYGFFSTHKLELGVHISIGQVPVEEMKYVALGIMSIFPPTFDPKQSETEWLLSLRNLFSKGFIYNNPNTQPVYPEFPHSKSHTEIRVISIRNNQSYPVFRFKLNEALRAAQYWGREIDHQHSLESQLRFSQLKASIDELLANCNLDLMNSTWEFGTGDPFELATLEQVPIVGSFKTLRKLTLEDPLKMVKLWNDISNAFLMGIPNHEWEK